MLRTSKQTNKHGRLRLVGMKQGKAEAYEIRETKKEKQKMLNQGFQARVCVRIHRKTQNREKTKTIKSNNLTYLRTEKLCKPNLKKHFLAKKKKKGENRMIKV